MTQLGATTRTQRVFLDSETAKIEWPFKPQLPGYYRAIGLAAVARGLELNLDDLEPELQEAIRRGARHVGDAWKN
jgi:hypothetical protein